MKKPSAKSRLLENPVCVTVADKDLDFVTAKELAKEKARTLSRDPMLLSWYSGKTGAYSPTFECGDPEKPAWIVFAEARGGDLTIDVNDGEYLFLFLSLDLKNHKGDGP